MLLPLLSLLAVLAVLNGCSTPGASFARPVDRAPAQSSLISGGATIPIAFIAEGDLVDQFDLEAVTTVDEVAAIPFAAFDYALSNSTYFGVSGAYIGINGQNVGVVVTPRLEIAMDEAQRLALAIELPLGVLEGDDDFGDSVIQPYAAPRVGLRWGIPTGFGGVVFTQQISIAFISFGLPGSLAYDIPIPLGDSARLHIFPEFRWDPLVVLTSFDSDDSISGFIMPLSVGGSIMLEL